MGKEEKNLRTEFAKIARQQHEKIDQVLKRLTQEDEKLKKGLGNLLREHQQQVHEVQQEMKGESAALEKKLKQLHKAVAEALEDASFELPKSNGAGDKAKVDELVNNPPNCSACEFPMTVLKESSTGKGSTVVYFSCPICNIERKATVSADGSNIDWGKTDSLGSRN